MLARLARIVEAKMHLREIARVRAGGSVRMNCFCTCYNRISFRSRASSSCAFSFPSQYVTYSRKGLVMNKLISAVAVSLCLASAASAKDIVDTAVSAGSFKTLATALQAAGLVDTLKGKGPFTVFAPTDAAFAKIPKADLDALLADKAKLTAVLTYHVVPGKVMAKDVKAGEVKTVEGSSLTVSTMGGVKVDNAKVTTVDIVADNGVIHVIDTVVMPN
jgi:uncharacterized surface protein with fasciclin (FAS1) repeats